MNQQLFTENYISWPWTSVRLRKLRLPLTCSFPVSLGSHLQSPRHPNHPSSHHGQGLSSASKNSGKSCWTRLIFIVLPFKQQNYFNLRKKKLPFSFFPSTRIKSCKTYVNGSMEILIMQRISIITFKIVKWLKHTKVTYL